MKKHVLLILIIVMLLPMFSCKNSDDINSISPEELGLQETNTNYTRDFDSATNQTITFGKITFQIPKKWTVGESTDVKLQINGITESQAGPMWVELLEPGITENDLASDACQQAILDSYIEMMKTSFENVTVTNSSYNSQSQLYFMNIEGTAYNIPAKCGICAFVEANNLYTYLVPFMEGDEYDYSLDVQEIVKSVLSAELDKDEFAEDDTSSIEEDDTNLTDDDNSSNASTSDILVSFETDYIDGDKLHITAFTKNTSEEIFSGNVHVTFYSTDGKTKLGSDTIIVDELLPGRESWADIVIDAYNGTPKMEVDFSDINFSQIKTSNAEIDESATDQTKDSYYWNFYDVSWYNDITDIVVYTDGTCIVTVTKDTKEDGQFYASTIWSCGNDYGVETVQVIDSDGNILAIY